MHSIDTLSTIIKACTALTSSKLLTLALPYHKSAILSCNSSSKVLTNIDIDTNYMNIKRNMIFIGVTNNKYIIYSELLLLEQTNLANELATIIKKDEKILKLLKTTINKDKTLIIPTAMDIY